MHMGEGFSYRTNMDIVYRTGNSKRINDVVRCLINTSMFFNLILDISNLEIIMQMYTGEGFSLGKDECCV